MQLAIYYNYIITYAYIWCILCMSIHLLSYICMYDSINVAICNIRDAHYTYCPPTYQRRLDVKDTFLVNHLPILPHILPFFTRDFTRLKVIINLRDRRNGSELWSFISMHMHNIHICMYAVYNSTLHVTNIAYIYIQEYVNVYVN